jgi:hypothetical protein
VDDSWQEVVDRPELARPIGRVSIGKVAQLVLVLEPRDSVEPAIRYERGGDRHSQLLKSGDRSLAVLGSCSRSLGFGSTAADELLQGVAVASGKCRHPVDGFSRFWARVTRGSLLVDLIEQVGLNGSDL